MKLWLRAETKPGERRAPLAPAHAAQLIGGGVELMVERSPARAFPDADYERAGARLAPEGSWRQAAPEAVILGLKELPEDSAPLNHRHVYFAHAYKGQRGAPALLSRFLQGGGSILDLEFLTDDSGRRVAAFGRWAGFSGAAVGLDLWAHQVLFPSAPYPRLEFFESRDALLAWMKPRLDAALADTDLPSALVFGAKGRCGAGALDLFSRAAPNLEVLAWDKEETAGGGPFKETLKHALLVNCVLLTGPTPPFLTEEMLDRARLLRVVSDVSCDPYSPHNPLPIYRDTTTFDHPALRLRRNPPLSVTAIDHLPSLLPRESSEDFSAALLPHLKTLEAGSAVWARAEALFREKAGTLTSGGNG